MVGGWKCHGVGTAFEPARGDVRGTGAERNAGGGQVEILCLSLAVVSCRLSVVDWRWVEKAKARSRTGDVKDSV